MLLPAGKVPDEPAIDGSERQLAGLSPLPRPGDIFQDPRDLRTRKVGIDQQAGFLTDRLFRPIRFHLVASFRGSAILPDNCVVDRLARLPVPDNRGLPLIGDANSRQVASADASLTENLDHRTHLRGKNVEGVMLDPSALGVNLLELPRSLGDDVAVFAKQNGSRAGRSLIKRKNVLHGTSLQCLQIYRVPGILPSKNRVTTGRNRRPLRFPRFPVKICDFGQLHAVLFKENHIRGRH